MQNSTCSLRECMLVYNIARLGWPPLLPTAMKISRCIPCVDQTRCSHANSGCFGCSLPTSLQRFIHAPHSLFLFSLCSFGLQVEKRGPMGFEDRPTFMVPNRTVFTGVPVTVVKGREHINVRAQASIHSRHPTIVQSNLANTTFISLAST
jgi:hypothetical protein